MERVTHIANYRYRPQVMGFGAFEPNQKQYAETPTPGFFYRSKNGDTPWKVSNAAYAKPGLATVKSGLMLLNNSPWNTHIRKAKTGWESYKIKGLQLTAHYDPNNPLAVYGSGKSFPVIWVPPLNGGEPGTVFIEPPEPGPQGPIGPIGPPGSSGKTPTTTAIQKLINDFLKDNPPARGPAGPIGKRGPAGPGGLPGKDGAPGRTGAMGPRGAVGPQGPVGLPGSASPDTVKKLISDYLDKNPISAGPPGAVGPVGPSGPRGATGPRGAIGPVGPSGSGGSISPGEIAKLVQDYLKDNPPAGSGGDFDLNEAKKMVSDYVDFRLRKYQRENPLTQGPRGPAGPAGPRGPAGTVTGSGPPEVQTAGFSFWGVLAAATVAGLLVGVFKNNSRGARR